MFDNVDSSLALVLTRFTTQMNAHRYVDIFLLRKEGMSNSFEFLQMIIINIHNIDGQRLALIFSLSQFS